jgi:hypothetical protein
MGAIISFLEQPNNDSNTNEQNEEPIISQERLDFVDAQANESFLLIKKRD